MNEKQPLISVVLPVYNGAKFLEESINSVLNQTHKNLELIIVNDCSTDNSLQIAEAAAARDERVRVISNEKNLKLPASLNVGFSASKGEFLTWTSDDNAYLPEALERMLCALAPSDAVMVCADYEFFCPRRQLKITAKTSLSENLVADGCGACFLYRRRVLEELGGYSTDYFLVEDYEYWLRILTHFKDGSVLHLPEVLYRYRRHEQSLTAARVQEVARLTIELLKHYYKQHASTNALAVKLLRMHEIFDLAGERKLNSALTEEFGKLVRELGANGISKRAIYNINKRAYKRDRCPEYKRLALSLGLLYGAKSLFWKAK